MEKSTPVLSGHCCKFMRSGNFSSIFQNKTESSKRNLIFSYLNPFFIVVSLLFGTALNGQLSNTGCLAGGFGIDGGLYSNIIEYGTASPAANSKDWFTGTGSGGTGIGVINESNAASIQSLLQGLGNPTYEARMASGLYSIVDGRLRVDAVFARDHFGGTGAIDQTSYETASKNGEDPAIWDPGPQNVLGKNDLVDVGGHMFRNGTTNTDDLWFVGLINRAEPGGAAYMDFEFFVQDVTYNSSSGFSSGGPDLGHTAYRFDSNGNITRVGDFIITFDLEGGGTVPFINIRVWVSRADFDANRRPAGFTYGAEFDGASQGSPFGYARIIPTNSGLSCGYVNLDGQMPAAPPWGTLNTKSNIYRTTYSPFSFAEAGVNLTAIGLDPNSVSGSDPCQFPYLTFIIKTRASASFTAQLKDFGGPYAWGRPGVAPQIIGSPQLSCIATTTTLAANPLRTDVNYQWTTVDGRIVTNPANVGTIVVDQPGTYTLSTTLPNGCVLPPQSVTVGYNTSIPFLNDPTTQATVSCNGNDGTAEVNISGGSAPYAYQWAKQGDLSFTGTTRTISGLSPGTYNVTITDVNTCTKTASVTVAGKINPTIAPTTTNVSCSGGSDGTISLSLTGGRPPFTYLWSNGNASASISNLTAGTYTVTITDTDGCQTVAMYTLTQPAVLTSSGITKTDDTNPDINVGDGTITLGNPTGGTAPYTYSWTGPSGFTSTAQNLSNLKYGQYTIVVTDSRGCTYTTSAFIYEPEICNDGTDNDGDGLNNCDDPDCMPPATAILNNPPVCLNDVVTYNTTSVTAGTYDSYLWTVPAAATVQGSSTGNSLTLQWASTAGGQLCVQGVKFSCNSDPACIQVSVGTEPLQPTPIIINN